jgi:hypothetical protein
LLLLLLLKINASEREFGVHSTRRGRSATDRVTTLTHRGDAHVATRRCATKTTKPQTLRFT